MRLSVKIIGAAFVAILLVLLYSLSANNEDRHLPAIEPAAGPGGPVSSGPPDHPATDPGGTVEPALRELNIKTDPVHPSLERFGVPMSAEIPADPPVLSRDPASGQSADIPPDAVGRPRQSPPQPGPGDGNATSPAPRTGSSEAFGPASQPFNINDPGSPPDITDPVISGPPPEAGDPGVSYPAPEASDPGIAYPAPEDSDPGIDYPAPEDSTPDPARSSSRRQP